jgi:hypothetical protein
MVDPAEYGALLFVFMENSKTGAAMESITDNATIRAVNAAASFVMLIALVRVPISCEV